MPDLQFTLLPSYTINQELRPHKLTEKEQEGIDRQDIREETWDL